MQYALFKGFHVSTLVVDAVAFSSAHFGAGIGSIFLDSVICSSSNNRLIDCTRSSSVICSNGHNEDAGVRCQIEGMFCSSFSV